MAQQVTSSDQGGVRTLTIANSPRGYMNAATAQELLEHLQAAQADDGVRALVFTGGVPGVFIRHYDVGEIMAVAQAARAGELSPVADRAASPVYAMFDLMLAFPKPTIAAINGMCMGGGFEFALACDIRVAQHGDYTIGLPETQLGIIPGLGGMQLLARAVGISRAREMVMRGRVVDPAEAHALGMVHELADDALASAQEIADELASLPAGGIASVKRMAQLVEQGEVLSDSVSTAAVEFMRTLVEGDDAVERMSNFLNNGEDILADNRS